MPPKDQAQAVIDERMAVIQLVMRRTTNMLRRMGTDATHERARAFCGALDAAHTGEPYDAYKRTGYWSFLASSATAHALSNGVPPDVIRFLAAVHLEG